MIEYGRKPYLADTYDEMMSRKTNAEVWADTVEKHSEFEKPYLTEAGEYGKMQHYRPTLPGLGFELGNFDFEIDPYGSPYIPWHITFICDGDLCYCKGETLTFPLNCSYPIIGTEIISGCEGIEIGIGDGQITVTASDDPGSFCSIAIIMKAPVPYTDDVRSLWKRVAKYVTGKYEAIKIGECSASECCSVSTAIAWDDDNSDDTIAQNGTAAVAITGASNSDFTWSVSGSGFTLDYATTSGLSNTLNADAAACGTATITVTGCDGSPVTGYVRSDGQWVFKSKTCGLSGAGVYQGSSGGSGCVGAYYNYEFINDNKRQLQTIADQGESSTPAGENNCGVDPCCDVDCDTFGYQDQGNCIFTGEGYCSCLYSGAFCYWRSTSDLDYYEWECI